MKDERSSRISLVALAFVAATVTATVWGSVVQTQYNVAALISIGAPIDAGVRWRTTLADVFSGFSPTYGGYVVAPALLVGFLVAAWIARRLSRPARSAWFSLGGGLALLLAIPLVNYLAPVALLVGATRDVSCTILMALGGVLAGLLFATLTSVRVGPDGHDAVEAGVHA